MTQPKDRSRAPSATILRHPMSLGQTESTSGWYYALFSECPHPTVPPGPGTSLCDFQRMHFCDRRMAALLQTYGGEAIFRDDYLRMSRLRQQIADKIALDHLELVYSLYRTRTSGRDGTDGPLDDQLLNEGLKALARAIDTFDPERGVGFANYACSVILRAFYRHARSETHLPGGRSVEFTHPPVPAERDNTRDNRELA